MIIPDNISGHIDTQIDHFVKCTRFVFTIFVRKKYEKGKANIPTTHNMSTIDKQFELSWA